MGPETEFSWDLLLFALAGPLGVLAVLVLLGVLGWLLSKVWRWLGPPVAVRQGGTDGGLAVVLPEPEPAVVITEQQPELPPLPSLEKQAETGFPAGRRRRFIVMGLLAAILLIGAYFRFVGLNWDENQHLHPDERFMTMVAGRIRPVANVFLYFDTERSSLNPFVAGSYTYGMLPLFLTRYVAEWVKMTEYDRIALLGRVLSGLFDLGAVGLLYLLGKRLYNRRVGLLAAALSAAAVLPIQLSHYFAVDSFAPVFIVAAFYVAVQVMETGRWRHYALFGVLAGMAMACKVTTAPILGIVGAAGLVHLLGAWSQPTERRAALKNILLGWALAALMAALFFRVFQPYAFAGPGFFGLEFNPRWLDIMKEVRNQVSGRAEWPPNHHWTNRPMLTFAWTNLAVWGVGLPLGVAATLGWFWAAWRCWRGQRDEWKRHLLPVVWVGGYFAWQNFQFWRYMRYFMPIYPLAILLAAWALVEVVDRTRAGRHSWRNLARKQWQALPGVLASLAMVVVLVATYGYAFAFTRIYTRPHTRVEASRWMLQNIPGPLNVVVKSPSGYRQYPLSIPHSQVFAPGETWSGSFRPSEPGVVVMVTTMHVGGVEGGSDTATVQLKLVQENAGAEPLAVASTSVNLLDPDARPTFVLSPVTLQTNETYAVILEVVEGGPLTLGGSRLAVETSWDDVLPLRVDGYDPMGGIYQLLNLKLFEADTEAKRDNMLEILEQADVIVISSNRAYDAMPRLPLRYPLTLAYFQALFDCPQQLIAACAYPAVPPLQGPLGFELAATFESNPTLGPFAISDQSAEEAFTVYDHPKVLIFRKGSDFSLAQVRDILERVDLAGIIEQGPVQYTNAPTALQLPPGRWAAQRAGGTWSASFDFYSFLNRYQPLGVLAWYGLLLLLGWLVFPLVFVAFWGLADRGYPLARIVALLGVGWLAWFSASYQVLPFTRATLWLATAGLALVSALVARRRWREIKLYLRARRGYILVVEGLLLALFVFVLVIRWHNPDLWQPWRGGEKPMDFAYFNAVLKSSTFPPYDPWMSGGILNYYYYGYVLAAVLTKMLGIVPVVAYNLALPTWFAMTGIGAFCVAYNLAAGSKQNKLLFGLPGPYLAGIVAVLLMVCLGNLFEVQVLWDRLTELSASPAANTPWYREIGDVLDGVRLVLIGEAELIGEDKGRWYFGASRAILHHSEGTPITEFPFFSFLYADLHPHLLDMPVLLAALAWMLSFVMAGGRGITVWLVGGLVLGATYPTHTWDFPTFAGLGTAAVVYGVWLQRRQFSRDTAVAMAAPALLLLALAVGMYAPFRQWFGSDYVSAELWDGPRTPLRDYLTVHGLFFFILITFLAARSAGWVRAKWQALFYTPLGILLPVLRRNLVWMMGGVAATLAGLIWLWRNDYHTLALAAPLLIWTVSLLLSGQRSPGERFVLALVAAGLGLTSVVEVVVLKGDVGRSNTVFKFYLQVWLFFSVAAGAALVWLLPHLRRWSWRWQWVNTLALLALAAGVYPVLAIPAKVGERWPGVDYLPRTLDGMAYMLGDGEQPAVYRDEGRPLNLAADYAAMRWMQDNVSGTPVIVEGNTPEYRWGSRYAVYTGLPAVVGWSWHLRQHNSVTPGVVVERRIEQVRDFYNTTRVDDARAFLQRYQVGYIVVGDLERIYYSAEGLAKFPQMAEQGVLQVAFDGRMKGTGLGTVIYQVNSQRGD